MSTRSYLIVFHAKREGNGNLIDISDDPCFNNLPSWGICRPLNRKFIKIGDTLFFIGKISDEYIFKGWFEVGEKIDYVTALNRFPERSNVIISKSFHSEQNDNWRYKSLRAKYEKVYGSTIPHFLNKITCSEGIFYQNNLDNHEIDNWKCRRVFNCNYKQFIKCTSSNKCYKDDVSLNDYKNYIIAKHDNWADVSYLNISWNEIALAIKFDRHLRTAYNQHNVLRIDKYSVELLNYLNHKRNV